MATKSNFDKFHFFSLARYYTFIYFIYIYSNLYFNSKSRPSSVKIGQCRLNSDSAKLYIYTHDIKIINLISYILLVFLLNLKYLFNKNLYPFNSLITNK